MKEIRVKNLTKIYNQGQNNEVKALRDVSFTIEEGEFVVILGASGAGKSTLLNLLGGMDSITDGEFFLGDRDISKANDKDLETYRREDIGFVFQFYNLMMNLTAYENVLLTASLAKDPLSPKEVLKSVGLENRADNFPSQLSGGEQQRIAIARAIVKNPSLLLCDEPTGALDSKTGSQILKLLLDVCEQYHKTVLIVTHNSKIAQVAGRVLTMSDGQIVSNTINEKVLKVEDIVW